MPMKAWSAGSGVSCCGLGLMEQPTEDVAAAKLTSGRSGHRISNHRRHRRRLGQAAVRPPLVVMLDMASHDASKLLAANDQQLVQALPTHRPNPALSKRQWRWAHRRACSSLGPGRVPHVVERPGELGVPVTDQQPPHRSLLGDADDHVPGLPRDPQAARMVGDSGPGDLSAPCSQSG